MSGGHWDYAGGRLRMELEAISSDEQATQHWPMTTRYLGALADALYEVERVMDWALSGDTDVKSVADEALVRRLLDALPDEWFPRGKWATIQAVQARMVSLDE